MSRQNNKTPVASWLDYEFFTEEQRVIKSLTVIVRTTGCQWQKCTMCGYWHESVSQPDIMAQLERSLRKSPDDDFILKIFTSGSFLDEREIPRDTRKRIAKMVEAGNIKKLIVETRPEFVRAEKIADLQVAEHLELAIGLETADDFIRAKYINKGFSFDDYKRAAKIVHDCGATVKTYLLLKPPFVSEKKAIEDAVKSAELIAPYSSTISLNLSNVQRYTLLETLWQKKYFRPPWLWSAVEAIKEIKNRKAVVMSDPVGAGHIRGPHNCGTCDREITEAIKQFNITQDLRVLDRLKEIECECRSAWRALIKFDDFLFGATIF
jgi:radical SAM enzyme (TIGR01210 family)